MLGTNNVKKAALLGVKLGMQIEKTFADGRLKLEELPDFIDELLLIPEVVQDAQLIADEFLSMTLEERQEVLQYVEMELQLVNDRIEYIVEEGLGIIISIVKFVTMLRNK